MMAVVAQVSSSATHSFSKFAQGGLRLIEGQGVDVDAYRTMTLPPLLHEKLDRV